MLPNNELKEESVARSFCVNSFWSMLLTAVVVTPYQSDVVPISAGESADGKKSAVRLIIRFMIISRIKMRLYPYFFRTLPL